MLCFVFINFENKKKSYYVLTQVMLECTYVHNTVNLYKMLTIIISDIDHTDKSVENKTAKESAVLSFYLGVPFLFKFNITVCSGKEMDRLDTQE